jgi:hypothetical protein
MKEMDVPGAESFSQMCLYLSSEWGNRGDVEMTREIMKCVNREPQTFMDWLLTHSDEGAFERVGLTVDGENLSILNLFCWYLNVRAIHLSLFLIAKPIQCVAVFNASCMQGKSVIRGLLADKRKEYTVRACICKDKHQEAEAQALLSLDSDRITIHYANQEDAASCVEAVTGAEGVFVVTDFYNRHNLPPMTSNDPEREEQEEKRARNVIDACAATDTVRHIVFSTLESVEDVDKELQCVDDGWIVLDGDDARNNKKIFDGKARMAAYARSRGISITFILVPVYSEEFFHALAMKMHDGNITVEENYSSDEDEGGKRVVCMSVDELGPAVANIMDSYEVYAGHEIALMTGECPVSRYICQCYIASKLEVLSLKMF